MPFIYNSKQKLSLKFMSKGKMRTKSFLRSLSSRLPSARRSASPAVAPLPIQTPFSKAIATKLDTLIQSDHEYATSSWLADVLDVAVVTQKATQEYVINNANVITLSKLDKRAIEAYLEDNVEMLDTCNVLVEKMIVVVEYMDSVRAKDVRCHSMFKQLMVKCATLDKCSPNLCRLMGNKGEENLELNEVLSGSREVASMSCQLLQRALSVKSRQGVLKSKPKLPTTWATSLNQLQKLLNEEAQKRKKCAPWMMNEVEKMVMNARILQDRLEFNEGSVREFEEGVRALEERVKELYKHLISIRMGLLGILSRS